MSNKKRSLEQGLVPVEKKKHRKPYCIYVEDGTKCETIANYGYEPRKGLYCARHSKEIDPNMKNVMAKGCKCGKTSNPCFGYEGGKKECCAFCKDDNMINLKSKNNSYECTKCGSKRNPNYWIGENKSVRYCFECSKIVSGIINNYDNKCQLCKQVCASFGKSYDSKPTHCAKCNTRNKLGLILLKTKHCIRCVELKLKNLVSASYGFEGESALYCFTHKKFGMINVKAKKCEVCFTKQAVFGYEKGNPLRCFKDKDDDMIDVQSKMCDKCDKLRATFGRFIDHPAEFCKECAPEGYIDVKNRKCQEPNCTRQPRFGNVGERPVFCSKHKTSSMINLIDRLCSYQKNNLKCTSRVSWGLPGKSPDTCVCHKKDGYVFQPRATCFFKACSNIPVYGIETPLHCEVHKTSEEINLIHKKCTSCELVDLLNDQGICRTCDPELFEKVRLRKQNMVKNWIDTLLEKHPDLPKYVYDRPIDTQCSRKRPDFMFDAKTHILFIEVDENQHSSYTSSCEDARMQELVYSVGMHCTWLRFNPDCYTTTEDGDFEESNVPMHERKETLCKLLLKHLKPQKEQKTGEYCKVIYMYYNDYQRGQDFPVRFLDIV